MEDPLNWVLSKRDSDRPTHVPASTVTLEIPWDRKDVSHFGLRPRWALL